MEGLLSGSRTDRGGEENFDSRHERRAPETAAHGLLGSPVADLVLFLFLRLILGWVLPV